MTPDDPPTLATALRRRWIIWNKRSRPTTTTQAVQHALRFQPHTSIDPYTKLWDYMFLSSRRPSEPAKYLITDLALGWKDLDDAVYNAYIATDWTRDEDRAAFDNVLAAAAETAARRRGAHAQAVFHAYRTTRWRYPDERAAFNNILDAAVDEDRRQRAALATVATSVVP